MTRIESDGRRRSILNTQTAEGLPRDDLMVLAGVADLWFTQHTSDGSIVKVEGRDLRGVFLDSPINPEVVAKLNLAQPVTDVCVDILRGHPAAQYMKVLYIPEDWPDLTPPPVLDVKGLTRVRRKVDGAGTQANGGAEKVNIWDLITKYCFLVGAIPFFRGRNLIIRPSASVFDPSKPKAGAKDRVFDPAVRYDDSGNPFETRKMVFGRNIKELSFERKLSGTKVPVIEVVSFDTSSKDRGARKMLIEQWPPDEATASVIKKAAPLQQQPLFSGEGPEFYDRAFAANRQFAIDPPWVTELDVGDEADFRLWVTAFKVPFDVNAAIVDYDMRGFWLGEIKPGNVWDGGHFPDTWKTPYDTTFSAESKYAVTGCPLEWDGDRLFNTATGRLIFGAAVPVPTPRSAVVPPPTPAARVTGVSPSGEVAQTDKIQISVPGVRDRERLIGIAKSLYEEIGRGELGGSCKTTMLSSFKGSNDDPDLLRLRPGDPCEFLVDVRTMTSQAPSASTYVDSARKSFAAQVQEVKEALSGKTGGGDENLARVLVASARSSVIDLLRTFRTANVIFNWTNTTGVQVAFDFQNYFVVRHGINEQLGKNVIPPVEKVVVSTKSRRPKNKKVNEPVVKSTPTSEKSRLSKLDEKGFIENSAGSQEFF